MIVRFLDKENQQINYGFFNQEEDLVYYVEGDIFSEYTVSNRAIGFKQCKLLAPVVPTKVVAIGLNYKDHVEEVNLTLPEKPMIFIKPPSAVIGPNDEIEYPDQSEQVEFEAELGVIIKKEAKNIKEVDWQEYVLGFTCANDVTARDIQFSDKIMMNLTWAKSFDTFCPLGPGIVDLKDSSNLAISLYLNGERKQHSNTSELIFSVPYLVSYVSKIMTLMPGDVIITGTPHGIGKMKSGDEVVVEIEGIGKLRNRVK